MSQFRAGTPRASISGTTPAGADEYAGVRVLMVHHTDPRYFEPFQVAAQQINCGPYYPDQADGDRVVSLQTPKGRYDLRPVLERIPPDQRPDLVVVRADASRMNFPQGLDGVNVPKIMLVGDTGHLHTALRVVLDYAHSQPYDAYVTPHMPRHAHFFVESGLENYYWLPGLSIRTFEVPFLGERSFPLTFIGQAGTYHPNRVRMIERLKSEGLPLIAGRATQQEAFNFYADSVVTLNLSGNGDLNMRTFEVLAAGGFLLNDDVEWQSGRDALFQDGLDLVYWRGLDDLCEKIRHYLQHPDEALAIAREGRAAFWRSHDPALKRRQLLDLVFRGWVDPAYEVRRDPRCRVVRSSDPRVFRTRLSVVEYIQTLHLYRDRVPVAFFPGASPELACDLADLPRVDLQWLDPAGHPLFARAGTRHQVHPTTMDTLHAETRWAAVVVAAADLGRSETVAHLARVRPEALIVSDILDPSARSEVVTAVEQLRRMNYRPDPDGMMAIHLRPGFEPERAVNVRRPGAAP